MMMPGFSHSETHVLSPHAMSVHLRSQWDVVLVSQSAVGRPAWAPEE